MPTIDLSFTVTSLITVCALLSPILTALINNQHQIKVKKLDLAHSEKLQREEREREIFEGYLRSAGACIQAGTAENLSSFGEHSELAIYYVPEDIREDMIKLEKIIRLSSRVDSVGLLARINDKLRAIK